VCSAGTTKSEEAQVLSREGYGEGGPSQETSLGWLTSKAWAGEAIGSETRGHGETNPSQEREKRRSNALGTVEGEGGR